MRGKAQSWDVYVEEEDSADRFELDFTYAEDDGSVAVTASVDNGDGWATKTVKLERHEAEALRQLLNEVLG